MKIVRLLFNVGLIIAMIHNLEQVYYGFLTHQQMVLMIIVTSIGFILVAVVNTMEMLFIKKDTQS